jgi:hypothetical protein
MRSETASYLDDVERHARRTFRFRTEVGLLAELGGTPATKPSWEELLFTAKFVTNAAGVLRRIGPSAEEAAKLSAEFSSAIERGVSTITSLLAGAATDERIPTFQTEFLSLTPATLDKLLDLFSELAWIKNYLLDHETRRP